MRTGVVAVLGALLLFTQSCVESACYTHSDCPDGQVCGSNGKCRQPECTSHDECGDRQVCENYSCVEGCVEQSDCDDNQVCSSNRCVALNQQCDCPSAPIFCLQDVNPQSGAVGKDVCLDHFAGNGVVLFFGSIACPHCHGLFKRLEAIKETLKAEGLSPVLLFVNLKSVVLDGPTVQSLMDFATEPLLQDTDTQDVWGDFGADWYEVVMINRNGCMAAHLGPLSENDLVDEPGAEFAEKWRKAANAACNTDADLVQQDVVTLPDVRQDTAGDVTGDLDQTETQDLLPDASDAAQPELTQPDVSDMSDLLPADLEEVSDVEQDQALADVNFELTDVCQIAPVNPISVGQSVPHFLCKDRNTTSATGGQGVSDITLKTLVWIAYTGACT